MIDCQNLVKIYKTAETEVVALQGLDLKIGKGELMAVIGNSGSGKSTLLNMLGGLDRPSAGQLVVDGKELFKLNEKELDIYRRETVGFIWQNHARNLIPYLTARDNIMIPMTGKDRNKKKAWADELLDKVGLYKRRHHRLIELSGGEQQRIAIGISLANRPKVLLADEPTGAVDSETADMVLKLFQDFNHSLGITLVIVTHDMALSRKVDRVVSIRDGQVSSEFLRKSSYREELNELGEKAFEEEDSHIELVVLDKYGRLQLPREMSEELKDRGQEKLLVRREKEEIILTPQKNTNK